MDSVNQESIVIGSAAAAAASLNDVPEKSLSSSLLYFLNPFSMNIILFVAVLTAKFLAEMLLDHIITFVLEGLKWPKMPTRFPIQTIKGLEKLNTKDHIFLFINQFVEFIFIQHLVYLIVMVDPKDKSSNPYGFSFVNGFENLSIWNTLVAFYLIFYVDDFMYYWAHRIMHMRQFYAYVHKHHHRQIMPERGYFDAANESPVESAIGLVLIWTTFHIVTRITGIHLIAGVLFFPFYATGAVLNHTVYDVTFGPIALNYSVRAHESHHRFSTGNYGQNTMFWDKVFGTYLEYRTPKDE